MARLNENQKRELCSLIASRVATLHIIEHFLTEHELEVSPQQIWKYRNSEKWAEFVEEERVKYDAAVDECHFSCKRNRMNGLHTAFLLAEKRGDAKGMVMAVAQAQKEMEGTKVRLTDKDGEDFQFNINIGPPPEEKVDEPKQVGPTLTLIPFPGPSVEDDE